MSRSWIVAGAVVVTAALALVVASPSGGPVLGRWMPAINFALGTALVTLAMIEAARAAITWLARDASLGWIVGSAIAALGLFVVGASSLLTPHRTSFDWLAFAGIFTVVFGLQMRRRHRAGHDSPA